MEGNINAGSRISYYRGITGIWLAATICFTWQLWSGDRTFPTAPLFGTYSWITGFQGLVYKTLLITAALLFAINIKFSEWAIFLLLLIGCTDDLNRIRPDFYHYFIIALFFCFSRFASGKDLIRGFRIIQGGIYLWTGIQKLNPYFIQQAPDFFYKAFHIQNPAGWTHYLILIIPLLEIFIGLQFLLAKKNLPSIILACMLHLMIIIQLYVSGWNLTLIPYNLFLIAGNFILFLTPAAGLQVSTIAWKGFLPKTAMVLFLAMPALNFIHLWPNYMSAGMYSYRGPFASVSVDENLRKKLPDVAKQVIYYSDKGDYLPFNYWDNAESGCIPNSERFVYRKIFEQIQMKYNTTDSVKLFIY